MNFLPTRFTVRRLMGAVAVVGVVLGGIEAWRRQEGGRVVGAVIVAACVAGLMFHLVSREVGAGVPRRAALLRSSVLAAAVILLPDAAFATSYWCLCGGRWAVPPYLHSQVELYEFGVAAAALIAIAIAVLLHLALCATSLRRSTRAAALCMAALILGALASWSWLTPRRVDYLRRASDHEVLEGMHGHNEGFPETPDFPLNLRKAAYHRRMREMYEHAARHPWISVPPEPPPPP